MASATAAPAQLAKLARVFGLVGVWFEGNWPCGQNAGRSPTAAESASGADEEWSIGKQRSSAGPALYGSG